MRGKDGTSPKLHLTGLSLDPTGSSTLGDLLTFPDATMPSTAIVTSANCEVVSTIGSAIERNPLPHGGCSTVTGIPR